MNEKNSNQNYNKVLHLNDILKSIRNVNQLIIREDNRGKIADSVCQLLVENRGFEHAWMLLTDKEKNYQYSTGYSFQKGKIVIKNSLQNQAYPECVQKAFKRNKTILIKSKECSVCRFLETSSEKSGLVTTIAYKGRLYGVLVVYLLSEYAKDPEEQKLISEIADDIAFAFFDIEQKEKNKIIEKKLMDSETRLKNVFSNAPAGIFRTTFDGKAIDANQEMARILGFDKVDDALNFYTNLAEKLYVDPGHRDEFLKILQAEGQVKNFQYQAYDRNKNKIWLSMNARINTFENKIDGFCWDITQEKKLSEELKKSEENLRVTIDSIGDAVISTDIAGNIVNINKIAQRLTGYHYDQALGEPLEKVFNIINAITREKGMNPVKRVLETGEIIGLANHTMLISKDLKEYQIADSAAPIKNDNGEIIGVVLVFRDVTHEYEMQAQLKKHRQQLQFVLEGGNIGTYIWHVPTGETFFNNHWAEMLGYGLEELQPTTIETWRALTHPEDLERAQAIIEKLFKREIEFYEIELRMKHKAGHWKWILDKGKISEWDENNHPVLMSGTHTDISRIKEAEEKVRQSEIKFKTLFSNMINGFALHEIIVNDEGRPVDYRFLEVNRAFEKLTGIKKEAIIGKTVTEALPGIENDPVAWIVKYGTVALEGEILRIENYSQNLNKWFDIMAYSPEKGLFATIFEDITDRKLSEIKLKESEKKFRDIIEYNTIPMAITDKNQDIILFNKKFTDTFGWSTREIKTADEWWDAAYPDLEYRRQVIEEWNRAVQSAIDKKTEIEPQKWKITCKSGHQKRVEFYFKSLGEINVISMKDITDFEKAQKNLREIHEIYQKTIENAHGVPYKLDYINEKYDFISEKCEALLGIPRAVINLKKVREIAKNNQVTDPNVTVGFTEYNRLFKLGRIDTYQSEFQIDTPDGKTKWISDRSLTIKENGKVVGSMGILQDITTIKDISEKLKYVHEIYRKTIINARGIPYRFMYNESIYEYIGEGFQELFGVDTKNLTIETVRQVVKDHIVMDKNAPEDYQTYAADFRAGKIKTYKVDIKIETPGGKIKWAADRSLPVIDDKTGKVIGSMGILQDITDQKQAEEALRKSEERFKLAVEGAKDGLWDWDLKTNRAYHSERFATMLGYEYGELPFTSETWNNLLHPDDREMAFQKVENYLTRKTDNYVSTFRMKCKDGSYRWITGRGKALFDDNGKAYRFLGFNTDITEQKMAEELNRQLEKQLRKKQKLETLGTLAGGIAHDFNNILTPILGYSDMAIHQLSETDEYFDNFQEIYKASLRAKDLIYQMLNFSRQTEQKRTPLDIVPIIKEALKLLRPSIPATIEIFSDLNAGKNIVLADPTKMHQVVVNLCTNAYQAMETKGGKLSIELKPVKIDEETSKNYLDLKAGDYLKLSITDTGNGMDARTRDRIFEPFFTTKEVNQGTGLGLAVVHGIVQSHEGTITVYSEPGEGSTFNVFLPVLSDQGNVEQKREPENFLPGTESILIVDDKVSVTKILEKMLDTLGYKTTIVNSSNEGLKLFEKNPDSFNMLITDLTMPELTGLELSRKIHQIRRGLPIIMITGYGNKLSRKEQEAAGITKLIGKPVLMGEISQLVRDLFDRMENE